MPTKKPQPTKPGLTNPTTKPTETINIITIDKEEDTKMPEKNDEDENDAQERFVRKIKNVEKLKKKYEKFWKNNLDF